MRISRILEEIFPFFAYFCNRSRPKKQCDCNNILNLERFADYRKLSSEQLTRRLDDEHQRASAIDEKTSKMTLSLSVSVMILGFMIAFTAKLEFDSMDQGLLILVVLVLLYILIAAFMALGALRTLPKYGYGTEFVLKKSQESTRKVEILADALARQECMNDIRHLRNEMAYQTLRNVFYLLFISAVIFGVAMSEEMNVAPSPPDSAVPHAKIS